MKTAKTSIANIAIHAALSSGSFDGTKLISRSFTCAKDVRGTGLERASRSVKQVIYSCQGEHSTKPAEARFRLEQLYGDVPRIELFARRPSEGWDIWGNECDSSVQMLPGRVA